MRSSDVLTVEREQNGFVDESIHLEQAARILDLEDWVIERLRHGEREISVSLPLVHDDGSATTITGYRVQHSSVRGPTMGGLRLCPDATLADTRAQAMESTWQIALLDAPFGGSAGAIICDPAQLSERELRHIVKEYAIALGPEIGPYKDVIVEDEGANPQVLAWILDARSHVSGHLDPAAVIGKPSALFGIEGHAAAMAHSVASITNQIVSDRKLAGARISIQGLGEYGHALARACDHRGMQIVGLADRSGGIYRPGGVAISSLDDWLADHGMLVGYADAEAVCNADIVECVCDVLIAATPRKPITDEVAANIHAAIVIEGVYGALKPGAIEVLEAHGIAVAPYMLAGAGGMAQACLEWMVNTSGHVLLTGEAEEHLDRGLRRAYDAASEASLRYGITLREGAYACAIYRVGDALRLR